MPHLRFFKLPDEKRRAILGAARTEFSEHGFEGASQNRILEAAGISKGALYYYFDDKADLYVTVLREEFSGLAEIFSMQPADSVDAFWHEVERMLMEAFAFVGKSPETLALARSVALSFGRYEVPDVLLDVISQFREVAQSLIEAGQEVGAIRDDLPSSLLAMICMKAGEGMDVWFAENMMDLEPEEFARLEVKMIPILRRLLERP